MKVLQKATKIFRLSHPHSGLGSQINRDQLLQELSRYEYSWQEFDLEGFVLWCEQRAKRKIELYDQLDCPNNVFGAFVRTDDTDWIFVASHLKGVHRLQAVLHELAHILLGHPVHQWSADEIRMALSGGPSMQQAAPPLLYRSDEGRSHSVYDSEAEMFASLILARIASARVPINDPLLRDYADSESEYFP